MLASHYEELIESFLVVDSTMNQGRAGHIWPVILGRSFAQLAGLTLTAMLVAIVLRTFQNRGKNAPKFDFVEIFAGVGHLSREMIRAGYKGCAFDINFDPTTQDALQACGLKLFVEAVGLVKRNGLAWLGTQCSSFVILCRHQAQRALDNFFLGPGCGGEDSPIFVQVGNGLMEVSSLLFFLCYLLEVWVVLEQPMTSCMPECPSMKGVLFYTQSARYVTYMGHYGGPSCKPLQLHSTWPAIAGLVCPRPAGGGEALVTRHGDQFTGNKTLLVQSQAYTPEFGRKVAEICRSQWQD